MQVHQRKEEAMAKIKGKIGKKVVSSSPVPEKKIVMLSFFDALREILGGERVTRVQWDNKDTYVFMLNDFLKIHLGDKIHDLLTSRGDMEGVDWYVLPKVEEVKGSESETVKKAKKTKKATN